MKRDLALDTLRGLMLVVMAIDHLGGAPQKHVYEFIGYATAAEGFVFLSGFVAGLAYSQYARRDPALLCRRAFQRAWLIYKYHLALLVLVGAFVVSSSLFSTSWGANAALFQVNPLLAFGLGAALLYQPRFMDILPMYVVLLVCLPLLIQSYERGQARVVLLVSALLWLFAQGHVREVAQNALAAVLPVNFGRLDILGFQLLFVIGSWLGYRQATIGATSGTRPWLIGLAAGLAGLLFLMKHQVVRLESVIGEAAIDRVHLGWLRLINFWAITYLCGWLVVRHRRLITIPWLAFLGQHSLEVFVYQVGMLYLTIPLTWRIYRWGDGAEIIASLFFVASLTLPAFLHAQYQKRMNLRVVESQVSRPG